MFCPILSDSSLLCPIFAIASLLLRYRAASPTRYQWRTLGCSAVHLLLTDIQSEPKLKLCQFLTPIRQRVGVAFGDCRESNPPALTTTTQCTPYTTNLSPSLRAVPHNPKAYSPRTYRAVLVVTSWLGEPYSVLVEPFCTCGYCRDCRRFDRLGYASPSSRVSSITLPSWRMMFPP